MSNEHHSFTDEITLKQAQAWEIEHQALAEPPQIKKYYQHVAEDLRREDLHERITAIFDRLDEQNKLLDAIATVQEAGREIPIFGEKHE